MNKRLKKIMEYIPKVEVLVDIGTDHGYIPVEAVSSGMVSRAIAADISKGSLEKAIQEIDKNHLKSWIDSRWGSGLSVLGIDEADVIVIAGMGGNLIGEILEKDYDSKFQEKSPLLILQPVQFPEKLRDYLSEKSFCILEEDLVKDEGIIYQVIIARKTKEGIGKVLSDLERQIGTCNLTKNNPLLIELLHQKARAIKKILEKLPISQQENIRNRRQELETKLREYEEMIGHVAKRTE